MPALSVTSAWAHSDLNKPGGRENSMDQDPISNTYIPQAVCLDILIGIYPEMWRNIRFMRLNSSRLVINCAYAQHTLSTDEKIL